MSDLLPVLTFPLPLFCDIGHSAGPESSVTVCHTIDLGKAALTSFNTIILQYYKKDDFYKTFGE